MHIKDVADNNIHVLPRIKVERYSATHVGFIIAWRDDNGNMQERYMRSYFLTHRWAKQIAESRGVQAIEHLIAIK